MIGGAITSEKTFIIQRDVRCRGCRYNLRGLASTGECPECGHPVNLSITDSMDSFLRSLPDDARKNLRHDVTFEPDGLWISGLPLVVGLAVVVAALLVGARYDFAGVVLGGTAGIIVARVVVLCLTRWRERRAIARYLSRQCIDRRLNRCPLCYHDLSGAMADTCPECGCPVSVRRLA